MFVKRRTRWAALSVVGLAGAAVCVGTGPSARAEAEVTFDAVTAAYGLQGTLSNPSIPTGITIEGSGPTSSAKLTSLQQSTAFSSLPYPGDVPANLSGVAAAISGFPVPPYPLYVTAQNGSPPPQGGHYPGIDLTASATDTRSAARATAISDAVGYVAESEITEENGTVTALSKATQNGLQIGGVLTLSGVVSSAQAILGPSGELATTSSMEVARFIAPGLRLEMPDEACIPTIPCIPNPFKGQTIGAPNLSFSNGNYFVTVPGSGTQKYPVSDQVVVDAFKAIGVDFAFQKAIPSRFGIVAPTLTLKTTLPSPPPNQVVNGATPVTYTLGRTSASIQGSVTNVAQSQANVPVIGGIGASDIPAGGAVAPGAVPSDAALSGLPGAAPQVGFGLPVGAPTTAGAVPGTAPATAGAAPAAGFAPGLAYASKPLADISNFYLVLIGVGLVGVATSQTLSYRGVRSTWKS